jgi:hypothetical protein
MRRGKDARATSAEDWWQKPEARIFQRVILETRYENVGNEKIILKNW